MKKEIVIDAQENGVLLSYKALNERIHQAIDDGYNHLQLINVLGQRFIGAGLEEKDLRLEIHGVPGNDLGIFMDGPTIEVFGNAEDQVGNTMFSGKIIIHGNAWDVAGLAARGGKIFVSGSGGYRIGIHMKEYQDRKPIVVYGDNVQEFLGEYLAGGIIVILGTVGNSLGSGMHGGVIYIRGDVKNTKLGLGAIKTDFNDEDKDKLLPILEEFCQNFNLPPGSFSGDSFTKIVPSSSRPYQSYYCSLPI